MGEIPSILETTDLLFVEWYVTCRPTGSSNSKNEDFMFGFKDIENGIESIKNIKIKNNEKKINDKKYILLWSCFGSSQKIRTKGKTGMELSFLFFFL